MSSTLAAISLTHEFLGVSTECKQLADEQIFLLSEVLQYTLAVFTSIN